MTYQFLLESVWHPPLLQEDVPNYQLPTELELQALWFSGAFGQDFMSVNHQPIRIIQFGEWNRSSGPDFNQVVIEIAGVQHVGDVELDLHAKDWENHHHARNQSFNNVILHVAFISDPQGEVFVRTAEHRHVPRLVVSLRQLQDALNSPLRAVAVSHPGRCYHPLKRMPRQSIEDLLLQAAAHRATIKAKRFKLVAQARGPQAALYFMSAMTLGYRPNSLAMHLLAQQLPLEIMRAYSKQYSASPILDALYFGAAGWLSSQLHEQAPAETQDYLRSLWDLWWKERTNIESHARKKIIWVINGSRPANHPHRRLGALAALVKEWNSYVKLAFADPFSIPDLIRFFNELKHPFWSRHYTLTSATTKAPVALIGKAHVMELLANHLIPLALLEKRFSLKDYQKIKFFTLNDKVKRCGIRLFGSEQDAKIYQKNLFHHQALLQLYSDFCLEDTSNCEQCPFPEQMHQWR